MARTTNRWRWISVAAGLGLVCGCGDSDDDGGGTSSGGGGGSSGTAGTGGTGGSTAGTGGGVSGTGGGTAGTAGTGGGAAGTAGTGGGTGGTGGTSGAGGAATGDRYVATDGLDSGDCSVDPCRTLAYAGSQMAGGEILVIKDGTYSDAIDEATFPRGSSSAFTIVRAEHGDATTITGSLSLYANDDHYLQFEGLRFESPDQKHVAGGNVRFHRTTFVGGPDAGNTTSLAVGTNNFQPGAWDILCEDCILRGPGGRYAVLIYRGQNVTLRRTVARKDGGWGIGSSDATEFEPEGVITFYETSDSSCEQCVVLDSLKLSHGSAEALGSIVQNSHTDQHTNVSFTECFAVGNEFPGFAFEGNGSVGQASVSHSYSAMNSSNGITANVDGTIQLTRVASVDNSGTGVASYGDATVTLTDSRVSGNGQQLDGVSGMTNGAGPHAIDLSAFDTGRLRAELCARAGVSRGFCGTMGSFAQYLESFE